MECKHRVYNRALVDLPRKEVVLTSALDILIAAAPENHRVGNLSVGKRDSGGVSRSIILQRLLCEYGPALKF